MYISKTIMCKIYNPCIAFALSNSNATLIKIVHVCCRIAMHNIILEITACFTLRITTKCVANNIALKH